MEEIELVEKVIGFEALYESMEKCRKGVMWKTSTASYVLNGIEKTAVKRSITRIPAGGSRPSS